MRFSAVIDSMLNNGRERWRRPGWNGQRQYIALAGPEANPGLEPFIVMRTEDGKNVPWLASQTDMLAEDWEVAVVILPE
jgi:hypothetical protein